MEQFPVTMFRFSTKYPESGTRMLLGRSYQFDAMPEAPDQRVFLLKIPGMAYFLTDQDTIDMTAEPGRNMAVLDKFYRDHKRAIPFLFQHPVYGELVCKFNRPLEIPNGIAAGHGVLEEFEVELIEQP